MNDSHANTINELTAVSPVINTNTINPESVNETNDIANTDNQNTSSGNGNSNAKLDDRSVEGVVDETHQYLETNATNTDNIASILPNNNITDSEIVNNDSLTQTNTNDPAIEKNETTVSTAENDDKDQINTLNVASSSSNGDDATKEVQHTETNGEYDTLQEQANDAIKENHEGELNSPKSNDSNGNDSGTHDKMNDQKLEQGENNELPKNTVEVPTKNSINSDNEQGNNLQKEGSVLLLHENDGTSERFDQSRIGEIEPFREEKSDHEHEKEEELEDGQREKEAKPQREEGEEAGEGEGEEEGEGVGEGAGEGEGEEEEEEGETRCVCGELDPPDERGAYIQCDKCSTWQHQFCVGFKNESELPEKYWCENCMPSFHTLYLNKKLNLINSRYEPLMLTKTKGSPPSLNNSSLENHRSTRRSARYNDRNSDKEDDIDLEQLKNKKYAKQILSANDDNEGENDQNQSAKNLKRKHAASNSNSPSKKIRKKGGFEVTADTRSNFRSRATSLAREEVQYQMMLEKAIEESKKSSSNHSSPRMKTDEEENGADGSEGENEENLLQTKKLLNGVNAKLESDQQANSEEANEGFIAGKNDILSKNSKNAGSHVVERHTENETEEGADGDEELDIEEDNDEEIEEEEGDIEEEDDEDGNHNEAGRFVKPKRPSRNTDGRALTRSKRLRSTKSAPNSPSVRRSKSKRAASSSSSPSASSTNLSSKYRTNEKSFTNKDNKTSNKKNGKEEISLDKPSKPRLPTPNVTLQEMHKRVGAIMEFVSRTKKEIEDLQSQDPELLRYVENQEFIEKFKEFNNIEILNRMDVLTEKLLQWKENFASDL